MGAAADRAKARVLATALDDPETIPSLYAEVLQDEAHSRRPDGMGMLTRDEWDDMKKFIRHLWHEQEAVRRYNEKIQETA